MSILGVALGFVLGMFTLFRMGQSVANVDEARGDSKAGCAFLLILVGGGILVILVLGGVR